MSRCRSQGKLPLWIAFRSPLESKICEMARKERSNVESYIQTTSNVLRLHSDDFVHFVLYLDDSNSCVLTSHCFYRSDLSSSVHRPSKLHGNGWRRWQKKKVQVATRASSFFPLQGDQCKLHSSLPYITAESAMDHGATDGNT